MMKKTLLATSIAASLFFVVGCTEQQSSKPQVVEQATKQAAVAESVSKAELGSFGVDLSARNLSVKAGDDFFMYASGTWYDNYEMPADKTRFGAFTALAERSEKQVKEIIDSLASAETLNAEEQMIADYFDVPIEKFFTPIETYYREFKDENVNHVALDN